MISPDTVTVTTNRQTGLNSCCFCQCLFLLSGAVLFFLLFFLSVVLRFILRCFFCVPLTVIFGFLFLFSGAFVVLLIVLTGMRFVHRPVFFCTSDCDGINICPFGCRQLHSLVFFAWMFLMQFNYLTVAACWDRRYGPYNDDVVQRPENNPDTSQPRFAGSSEQRSVLRRCLPQSGRPSARISPADLPYRVQ